MLRIYSVIQELLRELRGPIRAIERCDADLARQLRRSATSVLLNVAEGSYSRGRLRAARYHTALGSAREALACLEAAEALGYTGAIEAAIEERFRRVIGTLVRNVGVR